jgi:hypothetical protein
MPVDYASTKSKFPGLAKGPPKAKPEAYDEGGAAASDDEPAEGDSADSALSQAEEALSSALATVKACRKSMK